MINNLKNKYDLQLRFATKEEIEELAIFLAKKNWRDSLKQVKASRSKTAKIEADNFINKERMIILDLIGGKVLVQDYKKFDVSIFVYNYIQEYDKNAITSLTFRVLKTKKGMELLENEDILFNLKDLKRSAYHKKKVKSGRPSKPKDESIQKTIEIKRYLEANPDTTMDDVCHAFGFSKTTFYRTNRWLEARNM